MMLLELVSWLRCQSDAARPLCAGATQGSQGPREAEEMTEHWDIEAPQVQDRGCGGLCLGRVREGSLPDYRMAKGCSPEDNALGGAARVSWYCKLDGYAS
ncbi:hypothetical protein GW17_00026151 [Ensete ventricosum]|nr:hypothetical protein GW17_00026151 [Ensete ventricosum]